MRYLIFICLGLAFYACKPTETTVTPTATTKPVQTGLSYEMDIKPIVHTFCNPCHYHATYVMDLSTYDMLKHVADSGQLNDHLFVKGDMPPAGNPKPSDVEMQKIKEWILAGSKP